MVALERWRAKLARARAVTGQLAERSQARPGETLQNTKDCSSVGSSRRHTLTADIDRAHAGPAPVSTAH